MDTGRNTWEETKQGVEHFLQGIHLQSEGWNGPGKYDYIPDCKVLGKSNVTLEKSQFNIRTLVHATTPEAATAVLENGFKPNRKNLGSSFPEGYNNLVWWGVSPNKNEIEKYYQQCEEFQKKFMMQDNDDAVDNDEVSGLSALSIRQKEEMKEDLNKNFCSSAPFCTTSRYGNIIFEYNIDQLLEAYSSQYCDNEEPTLLVLGTFAYAQEVMHAVIVCPPSATELKEVLPPVPIDNASICKLDKKLVWRPETTGSIKNYYRRYMQRGYRRWEHVTLALQIPDGQSQGFLLNNLDMHMTYCPPSTLFRLHTDDDRDREKWTINKTLRLFDENILDIPAFIHRSLVSNWKRDHKQYEGYSEKSAAFKFMKISPSFMDKLLGGSEVNEESEEDMYDPDELLEVVRDPAKCKERWMLWIRQLAHYLLTD